MDESKNSIRGQETSYVNYIVAAFVVCATVLAAIVAPEDRRTLVIAMGLLLSYIAVVIAGYKD